MTIASPTRLSCKVAGQFFTPENVARSLVQWVVRSPTDLMLDPSCGDGAILAHHVRSRGVERDPYSAWLARERLPLAPIDNADFFEWALTTHERFECAAGNPPFIRYQNFKGLSKATATSICEANGVTLSGLSSAWAAFIVVTASLLKPMGRMAFVVPAEIGHAPYATALMDYLLSAFSAVQVIAIREKLFPHLSENCWLLYCEGRGGRTTEVRFTEAERFVASSAPPQATIKVDWSTLKKDWNGRLRTLLISGEARAIYSDAKVLARTFRFGDFAKIGIGYITGDNDFFHLPASVAQRHQIPSEYLVPTVRRGKSLVGDVINLAIIDQWVNSDEACFLLALPASLQVPREVQAYLDSEGGLEARRTYKCRTRSVWHSVPGIVRPDYFLQYMSGSKVRLARNEANAACTNSVLAVQIFNHEAAREVLPMWNSEFVRLSCELEGHPLGGGMLKLEPGEAARILFAQAPTAAKKVEVVRLALRTLRSWRHVSD